MELYESGEIEKYVVNQMLCHVDQRDFIGHKLVINVLQFIGD
jgi:hypothetical protein